MSCSEGGSVVHVELKTNNTSATRVFGVAPSGVVCHRRLAAYAVVPNAAGRVAAVHVVVRGEPRYWLPGGGADPDETPEDTIHREIREELGRAVRLVKRIGDAVQIFHAEDEGRWYHMTAVFFQAEWDGPPIGVGEYELHWVDTRTQGDQFFHTCHAWAASAVLP
jgi:ADP-ribose pyrophosphatase YjhB (NUDIX family)